MIEVTTLGTATVRRYASRQFAVALGVEGTFHKLFQVVFPQDGSLYLAFPYFRHHHGIAADVPAPPRPGEAATVQLPVHGWRTTHRVKYSHHPSGQAQFSQTGRVAPRVRKQAVPLAEVNGHLFTLYLKGVGEFAALRRPRDLAYRLEERTTILLAAPAGDPGWFRLVGRWYTLNQFVAKHRAETGLAEVPMSIDPIFACVEPGGRQSQRVLLSPLSGATSDAVLELLVEGIGGWDAAAPSTLLFLGGFDRCGMDDDPTASATFLALKYPADDTGEIWQLMRSIDLMPR